MAGGLHETQRKSALMGMRMFIDIMIAHIRTFNQPPESRSRVVAKDVLLVTDDRMEKKPDIRLRMLSVSRFSSGMRRKCSPKPRRTLQVVATALMRRNNFNGLVRTGWTQHN